MSAAGIHAFSDFPRLLAHLNESKHCKWGFVIYRCTYEDEKAWARFMQIMNERARLSFEDEAHWDDEDYPVPRNLLDALDWNVQDDRSLFDRASKDFVRDHFNAWVRSGAAQHEQPDAAPRRCGDGNVTWIDYTWDSPRYNFPIYVDADVLDSVVNRAPQPPDDDWREVGYVVLIDSTWKMRDPETFDWEDYGLKPGEKDITDQGEPPVDGCRLYEVGWMKVGADDLIPDKYASLLRQNYFYLRYKRPPEVSDL